MMFFHHVWWRAGSERTLSPRERRAAIQSHHRPAVMEKECSR
jgi:hypothetical protein